LESRLTWAACALGEKQGAFLTRSAEEQRRVKDGYLGQTKDSVPTGEFHLGMVIIF
jgi:hypothetical protein